jgi:hypothetical protein
MEEAKTNRERVEKLLDLGNGLSIWKVHLDALHEQDKNARVMPLEKFDRLVANIGKDKRLESLPLVTPSVSQGGHKEFKIISGHHRTRAARSAGIEYIHVMSIDEELTENEIKSKQLAHNALSGYDDPEILAEIYNSIDDLSAKLASGVSDTDFEIEVPKVSSDDIEVSFDFELLNILFLPKQANRFDEVLKLIEPTAKLYLANLEDFERMKNAIQEISKRENVRNISAIMARMLDIVEHYHAQTPFTPPEEKQKKKPKDN